MNNNTDPKIQEIRDRHARTEQTLIDCNLPITSAVRDRKFLLSEYDRLTEAFEVMAKIPMDQHPSEIREFARKILKGQSPHRGIDPALSHIERITT
ncbi:hypothetical protein J2T12_005076 [Paenibacillus anaericanus]|uniref:hypothetical protein n=1 Tax=Paenibacillus anaericanus TaxID=170367 RepID=UPI002783339E|nr:hypothetical protein [Paenibacillus anaericanus]MDQ0091636.1 hypothetical protein [Paenibacillus anaericanus]